MATASASAVSTATGLGAAEHQEQGAAKPMHFVLVPLMAQGHMIPTVDLARLLAERGVTVSLITTPFNLSQRLAPTVERVRRAGLPLTFVPLDFPTHRWGLPEGCENLDVLQASPDVDLETAIGRFMDSTSALAEPLKAYIRQQQQQEQDVPVCLVSDFCLPWTRHVSAELGIPRFVFYSVCCFTLCCHHYIDHLPCDDDDAEKTASDTLVIPDLPHRVEIARENALGFFPGPLFDDLRSAVLEAESTADGIIVNTFDKMEPDYVSIYQKAKGKRVYTVGPVSLCNNEAAALDKASRGGKPSMDESKILSWLDSMKPKSVVYVSLGSMARTTPAQLVEIGTGLEASGHPFIWVVKAGEKMAEVEAWLRDTGFEERNRGRGLVIRGWAPQVMILSHPSVGGFLTHCGWNSCVEGVTAGVPMLTWPCFLDQFLNEKFVVEVLRTGIPAGANMTAFWDSDEVLVWRAELASALEELMGGGEGAEQRRRRSEELGRLARDAPAGGGSSHLNMSSLLDDALHLSARALTD